MTWSLLLELIPQLFLDIPSYFPLSPLKEKAIFLSAVNSYACTYQAFIDQASFMEEMW